MARAIIPTATISSANTIGLAMLIAAVGTDIAALIKIKGTILLNGSMSTKGVTFIHRANAER